MKKWLRERAYDSFLSTVVNGRLQMGDSECTAGRSELADLPITHHFVLRANYRRKQPSFRPAHRPQRNAVIYRVASGQSDPVFL